jgi:predicted  nucleic acid-binding Zn-ribbon protein
VSIEVEALQEEIKRLDHNWTVSETELQQAKKKIERYEKALNECIHQDGLMDFLDNNSWACQEDYFVHLGKEALYNK